MKIAVVGCGALGTFYGARLCRAGQEVHFLPRSDYESVRDSGARILSLEGDFTAHPRCARRPEEIGPSDLVLIALKSTANHVLPSILPALVGAHSVVLTLQNGLGNEEELARHFPAEQIMGGLCFVCLNRIKPGVVRHSAHGTIVVGEFEGGLKPRTHEVAGVFRAAGIHCEVSENLARTHWEKLVWNIPFNGLGVASAAGYEAVRTGKAPGEFKSIGRCLATDALLADPDWAGLVRTVMGEVIAIANSLAMEIPEALADKQIERTRKMGAYKASTVVDFERGLPLELESLFLEPLRRGERANVPAPVLKNLCEVLRALDSRRERTAQKLSTASR
ncbi:MAG TPA: 2-dehydropantoate 2-reductase [Verrucomicrobiae bacterium]|nr:2-dehydropantoate 2-reductase [Verrucomicrobiae bacterium]